MSQRTQCFGQLCIWQCFTSVCVLGCRVPLVVIIILYGVFEAHSLEKCFLTQAFFQNPDTSIPTLTVPSVDVIFQELVHPLFSLLGFPSSTSKPDAWLKHTGSWLGFT